MRSSAFAHLVVPHPAHFGLPPVTQVHLTRSILRRRRHAKIDHAVQSPQHLPVFLSFFTCHATTPATRLGGLPHPLIWHRRPDSICRGRGGLPVVSHWQAGINAALNLRTPCRDGCHTHARHMPYACGTDARRGFYPPSPHFHPKAQKPKNLPEGRFFQDFTQG